MALLFRVNEPCIIVWSIQFVCIGKLSEFFNSALPPLLDFWRYQVIHIVLGQKLALPLEVVLWRRILKEHVGTVFIGFFFSLLFLHALDLNPLDMPSDALFRLFQQ